MGDAPWLARFGMLDGVADCELCGRPQRIGAPYRQHLQEVHGVRIVPCPWCHLPLREDTELPSHLYERHGVLGRVKRA